MDGSSLLALAELLKPSKEDEESDDVSDSTAEHD